MQDRARFRFEIQAGFRTHPIVAILGPRQCGKATLSRLYAGQDTSLAVTTFDLENPTDLTRLEDPMLALKSLDGLVIIDEIQRRPDLFPILRVLVDRPGDRTRFLILGSASPDLMKQSSETLAGRVLYLELTPFQLPETGHTERLWLRGGFPRSYLAGSDADSLQWRRAFIQTFLERDIPMLGIRIPAATMRRFWMMLAHTHGQTLNSSELGRSLGLSHQTIRHYLDILQGTYMVRLLSPWFENIAKRQVKSPKVFFRDSGILHAFLDLPDDVSLRGHPKLGASWEGFAMEEVLRAARAEDAEAAFWATQAGAELDLLLIRGTSRRGFEFKYTSAPKLTRSMHTALADLSLDRLDVVHPGASEFPLADRVRAVGLVQLVNELS